MTASTDQLPRLLALVPYLLAHPGATLDQIATTFAVDHKQARADLDLVFMCGLPGGTPGDLMEVEYVGDRVYLRNADTIERPLRLTTQEALALIVALRTLAELPGLVNRDAVGRALAKVESAAGDAGQAAGRVAVAVEAGEEVLAVVREGLQQQRRLRLRYYVPGRDEATEREVDPMRLFTAAGHAYLEAYCRRAEDVRLFRLDRMLEATVTNLPAEVPGDGRGRDVSAGVFTPSSADAVVTLDLAPAAHWVADYYPVEATESRSDGTMRVRMRTSDFDWMKRLLLGIGAAARVVDPPELAEDLRAAAAAALAAYD